MGAILLYDTICKMSTGRKHPADILLWKKEKYKKKESFPLMKNPLNEKKPNGLALIPFVIFIAIYMGAGVYYQVKGKEMAFYQFPSVTAMFLAVLAAFIMFKGTINEKFDVFAKGAANVDILTMLMIYILAGAFASVAANMGGRESTVNLGLSLVPVQFLAAGLFVISAFMGTATGSSMGTVSAVIPIAVGIAEKGGLSLTRLTGGVSGELNVAERKLGSRNLADNVVVFQNDGSGLTAISLSQIADGSVPASQITYAGTDWAGRVKVIVLNSAIGGGYIFGRANYTANYDEEGNREGNAQLSVEYGAGKSTPTFETGYVVRNGDIVGITIVTSGNTQRIGSLVYPDELRNVPNTAWSGKGAVTVNGRTYTVPASVPCYNTQTKSWVTLTEARAYADSATLYVYQGVVRFLEVG